ncbi:hypothetical protein AB0I94_30630 [Streptomyces sp. NPDC050147]|uniref:hypothetical protein n=1 Tax=Streptomyces sp. NPDC050147 TaxID=3155513 RepID=UPI00344949F6
MRLGKALATGIAEEAPQERPGEKDLERYAEPGHAEPEPEPAATAEEPAAEVPAVEVPAVR